MCSVPSGDAGLLLGERGSFFFKALRPSVGAGKGLLPLFGLEDW